MKHLYTLCFLIFFSPYLFSQDNIIEIYQKQVDKLKKTPSSYGRDTTLIIELTKLARSYVDESSDSSLKYINEARKLVVKYNWKNGVAHYWLSAGVREREIGHFDTAIQFLLRAASIFESTHNKEGLTDTFMALGIAYTETENYTKALDYHQKSIKVGKSLNDYVNNWANIGNLYMTMNKFDIALPIFIKLEKIYLQNSSNNQIEDLIGHRCVNSINLCVSYFKTDQPIEGEKYEKLAVYLSKRINGILEQAYLFSEIASYYSSKNNHQKALEYLQKSEPFVQALNSPEKTSSISLRFYQHYKSVRNFQKALAYYEIHNTIEDSLNRAEMKAEITKLQLQYDTKKQKEEIDLLTIEQQNKNLQILLVVMALLAVLVIAIFWNNRILRKQNEAIRNATVKGQHIERRRVAADLHDNLGSTLSALRWTLQAIDIQKLLPTEKKIYSQLHEMVNNAYNEVRSISHNMLPPDFEKQSLQVSLAKFLQKIEGKTSIHFKLDFHQNFERLNPKIEFELYNVCLELINNIIKHSQATEASIDFFMTKQQLKMIVADNGIGLQNNESNGIGFQNIKSRIDSMNGNWTLKSDEQGKGMIHEIIISINEK